MKKITGTINRSYSELMKLDTFEERYNYLKLDGIVGDFTFNGQRYLNQILYRSAEWRRVRRLIIVRDNGCDLGCDDHPIFGKIIIHHMNPITIEDVQRKRSCVFDPEYLITVSAFTHNGLHYGSECEEDDFAERSKYDTCPWRR